MDDVGYIKADIDMKTATRGVFAAGDVIRKKYRQITTAMGDATIAALSAIEYLNTVEK
jgi:thioredoxin reductase (NADPH)